MIVQSESLNAMSPSELDGSITDLQRKDKLDELVVMADKGEEAISGTAEVGADNIRYGESVRYEVRRIWCPPKCNC